MVFTRLIANLLFWIFKHKVDNNVRPDRQSKSETEGAYRDQANLLLEVGPPPLTRPERSRLAISLTQIKKTS